MVSREMVLKLRWKIWGIARSCGRSRRFPVSISKPRTGVTGGRAKSGKLNKLPGRTGWEDCEEERGRRRDARKPGRPAAGEARFFAARGRKTKVLGTGKGRQRLAPVSRETPA